MLGLRDRVLMDGAGHWLQYEKADAFNRILLQLLDRPVGSEEDKGGEHGR